MITIRIVAFIIAVGSLAGCGGPSETPGYVPGREELLKEVSNMVQAYVRDHKRSPARLEDLNPYEPENLNGYVAIRDGEVILLYGGPIGGEQVLAYEKAAPTEGGLVLRRDSRVEQVTAEEAKTGLMQATQKKSR